MRGLLDLYIRFLDWQTDRRACRLSPLPQVGELPQFRDYFDPVADPVAAVLHTVMGAGAAVLFGTTGQISGAYAAVVVGLSAPVLLTQLGRVQSVHAALAAGAPEPAGAPDASQEPAAQAAPLTLPPAGEAQGAAVPEQPAVPLSPAAQTPGLSALSMGRNTDPGSGPQAGATGAGHRTGPVLPAQANGHPPDAAAGRGRDPGNRELPSLRQQPVAGEEGTG
ncbi:hypothetical protein [Streptomyces hirsutus]|uniref:hypothetical protein n=1 Tax=Streptomyces hirsutus TaxID=35620 RepID=UPI00365267A6